MAPRRKSSRTAAATACIVSANGGEPRMILGFDNTAFYTSPSWSPDGATLALYAAGLVAPCNGYALVDMASGGVRDCLGLPAQASLGFGGGGFGASAWTPDGRSLVYHWQSLEGETGVAVVDLATGNRTIVPSQGVYGVGLSPDGAHVLFSAYPGIWVADVEGTGLALLAEGDRPAWQPVP